MKPTRSPEPKLGEMLEARGRLDREALFRAMRHQRAAGGRIGTCLLELDLVNEDELLHLLSEQTKLPFVEPDALRSVPEDAIRLVPAKVARARRAIPVRSSGSQLYVAMIDPHDIAAQDELSFVSGRRVRPQVATEVRIYEALARYYAVEIPGRFVKLLDRLNRTRYLWRGEGDAEQPAATSGGTAPPAPPAAPALLAAAAPRAPSPFDRPATAPPPPLPQHPPPAPTRTEPPAAPPPVAPTAPAAAPPPAAPPAAWSLDQAEARLLEPTSRDDVADVLVELARSRAEAALVLIVRRQEATGWRGAIAGRDEAAIRDFRISMTEPSMILALREGVPFYRGPLPPLRAHGPLGELLGDASRGEIFAVPLHVRQRLVGALVVASARAPLALAALDDLKRAAAKASVALEMLVLRQKLQHE